MSAKGNDIRSMTGFARQEATEQWGTLAWELRTVNHRYLDVSFRAPEDFRALEPVFREKIAKGIRRGKVDANLRFRPAAAQAQQMLIDEQMLGQLIEGVRKVAAVMPEVAAPDPTRLLSWPGVVAAPDRDLGPLHKAALALLGQTVTALDEARSGEGGRIATMLLERCDELAGLVVQVREHLPAVREAIAERLRGRVAQLVADPDTDRLEQELALMLNKMDVDEELDRLDSHVAELRNVLKRNEPVGRRLDFLMQEFNREANTLASKSQDPRTSAAAVDMKVLIEQMREQVQNVE